MKPIKSSFKTKAPTNIFGFNVDNFGFPVVAAVSVYLCRWPRCSEYILGCQYRTYKHYLWHSIAAAPLIQNENGKCSPSCSFLSGALTQVYVHTHVSIGPTHARLDATLGSRSGDCQWKRNFISHTRQFLQLSNSRRVVFLSPQG